MADYVKYFPEGVAKNESFINRTQEREQLLRRIKANQHTVLMAPRRYGKTSLVLKVASEMKLAYSSTDLLAAYDEFYVRDQIVSHVSQLVFSLLPRVKQAQEKLLSIFQSMKPEISLGAFGQRLSLQLSKQPLGDITEVLLKLDETAKHFNKKAVVFIDEFQRISQLNNYHAIEAAIRHAVERSENIAYVFSGSNRRLLTQMFGDSGRPLYRLCQTITLERMEQTVYVENLQGLAKQRWRKALSVDIIDELFRLTELHPFYMNVLCQRMWEKAALPSIESIQLEWADYVRTQRHVIAHDISELSTNQTKLMLTLAATPVSSVQAMDFTAPLNISPSSAKQAVDKLLAEDLLYKDAEARYCVLDPAMRYYLNHLPLDNH